MFENDHSAARGKMAVRKLIIFKHDSELGNAPSHKLFDTVHADLVEGVTIPRSHDDYIITVNGINVSNITTNDIVADGILEDGLLPAGVTCEIRE